MNIKHVIVAATVCTLTTIGFAGDIDPFAERNQQARSTSSKTRAEVKAEVAQARVQGYVVGGEEVTYPVRADFKSSRDRQEVREEARQSVRNRRPTLDYDVAG